MVLDKSIIYYTDNRLDEPIYSVVQDQLLKSELQIYSVSREMIPFGENYVVKGDPSYVTMVRQIIKGLSESRSKYVFFCEHDVLYPKSHFDFTPVKDDIFYYNSHVYRWDYPSTRVITYDRLFSLSSLCVNREFALEHYQRRFLFMTNRYSEVKKSREPSWQRKMGYEPGAKKMKRGGFSDDDFETWMSDDPIIDVRHSKTFSPRKVSKESFKHPPKNWFETDIRSLKSWNIKKLFNLWS